MSRQDIGVARRDEAQKLIGYTFRQPRLLAEALTHKSYVNELKEKTDRDNERLEFLGDAVLSLIISEHIAATYSELSEGPLSKRRSHLVSEATLADVARKLELGRLLRLGRGEELSQGRDKDSLLANALEALLAAIYLDGGLAAAREFLLKVYAPVLRDVEEREDSGSSAGSSDYKTWLQEWCQKRYNQPPQYETVHESGPDHQKQFTIRVTIQGQVLGSGTGRSKKEAEQMAAQAAWKHTQSA